MKKTGALLLAIVLILGCLCGCGKDKFAEGTYVQLGTYSDEPILWRVYQAEDGNAYLMADQIISIKAFDASGNYELGTARAASGANNWEHSALRAWLNAEAEVDYVQKPSKGFVYGGLNSYDTEPGFLSAFSEEEKAVFLNMQRTVFLAEKDKETATSGTEALARKTDMGEMATNAETAYQTVIEDKISLPCVTELAAVEESMLIASLTDSAKEDCTGHGDQETLAYWTITPNGTSDFAQCVINAQGEISDAEPRNSCIGVRPVICLNASGKGFTGDGTAEKPFMLKK